MHTATWNPDVDLKGKRVAVIGTGASAAQLIPSIADDVAQLTVFQRTKHWVISNPASDDVVSDGVKFAMRHIPHYIEWFRFRVYWFAADGLYPNVLMDPDWPKDSPAVSATNEAMWKFSMAYLEKSFADRPDLLAAMTPDFPVFSKRIIMDRGDYFATYKRPHVRLDQGKIARVVPGGIEMADGTVHAFDVLICATGFDVANMMGNLEITGIDGRRLRDEWGTEDPRAYFGMMVPGYPNYFHTVGPNSAPNHAAGQNLISERQVNWIIECLDHITAKDAKALMPSERAYLDWNARVEDQMTRMIWSHPKANSYYNNSKKRNYLSWPWRLVDLWEQSRHPRAEDFELLSD
jgi:4-hydroxyacetophenone monooxygenase